MFSFVGLIVMTFGFSWIADSTQATLTPDSVSSTKGRLMRREIKRVKTKKATRQLVRPWWNGAGPAADKTKSHPSKSMVVVTITTKQGLNIAVGDYKLNQVHDAIFGTDETGEDVRWLIHDSGDNRGYKTIESAYKGGYFLCENTEDPNDNAHAARNPFVMDSFRRCVWDIQEATGGKVYIRSVMDHTGGHPGKYIRADGAMFKLEDTASSADSELLLTIVSIAWTTTQRNPQSQNTLASPTTLTVFLENEEGENLKVNWNSTANGLEPELLPVFTSANASKAYSDDEQWYLIDAGAGWSYIKSKNASMFLTDKAGVLELQNWTDVAASQDTRKWWLNEVPSDTLPKFKLSAKSKNELTNTGGEPKLESFKVAKQGGDPWKYITEENLQTIRKFSIKLQDVKFQLDQGVTYPNPRNNTL